MYMCVHVGELLLFYYSRSTETFPPTSKCTGSCMTLTQIVLCVGLVTLLLCTINCLSCWVWRCLLLAARLTDLDTSLRWWGRHDNQACRFRSVGRWWGYDTAHIRSRSHKCYGHYTDRLKDWKEKGLSFLLVKKYLRLIYFTTGQTQWIDAKHITW